MSLIKPTISQAGITNTDVVIRSANGQELNTFGTQTVNFLMGSEKYKFDFIVSEINVSTAEILGIDFYAMLEHV